MKLYWCLNVVSCSCRHQPCNKFEQLSPMLKFCLRILAFCCTHSFLSLEGSVDRALGPMSAIKHVMRTVLSQITLACRRENLSRGTFPILSGDPFFQETIKNPVGKQFRFLKRAMVEQNGESTPRGVLTLRIDVALIRRDQCKRVLPSLRRTAKVHVLPKPSTRGLSLFIGDPQNGFPCGCHIKTI